MGKFSKGNSFNMKKSSTPQPQKKGIVAKIKSTPKSEPQPQRKKIAQEIDEAISDEEFEKTTKSVKELEKLKKKHGTVTPKPISPKKEAMSDGDSEEESDDEDFELDDLDLDSEDIDVSDEEEDSDEDEDSEDDEDDDDDDSDSEGVENAGQGKSKLAAKFKEIMEAEGELSSDDDDDDEDDDDGDDDESEESSEEEEDEPPPTKKKKVQSKVTEDKGKGKSKAQAKEGEKKNDKTQPLKETNQAQKRKREVTSNGTVSALSKADLEQDSSVQEDRDSRTLFVKLKGEVNEKKVRNLLNDSTKDDVLDIRIRSKGRAKKGARQSHVYIEFTSKDKAAEAHSHIKSQKVYVDFVGKNSKHPEKSKQKKDPEEFDPLRLYVTGIDRKKTTLEQLKKVFPSAAKVQLPFRKKDKRNVGYAFVHFKTAEECKKVHSSVGLTCNDRKLAVLYAKKTSTAKKSDNRPQKLQEKVLAKKDKSGPDTSKKQQEHSAKKKEVKGAKDKATVTKDESSEEDEEVGMDDSEEDEVDTDDSEGDEAEDSDELEEEEDDDDDDDEESD